MQPRVLDLYCSAGGVGLALDRLGLSHVGIDIEDKSNKYTGDFIQADASDIDQLAGKLRERYGKVPDFDLVWASPPCQAYSSLSYVHHDDPTEAHPTIPELNVREICKQLGDHYIIENVSGCHHLVEPTRINGYGVGEPYGLERWFETSYGTPHAVGTGSSELDMSNGIGRSYTVVRELKNLPDYFNKVEARSAIPTPFVQHLLHYCPSTPGVSPVGETKQTLLGVVGD